MMPKLIPIQALRGVAALAVAFGHGLHEWGLAGLQPPPALPWQALRWEAGVDVFFAISGFVMAVSSGPLFARAGAVRVFLARRLARIVPLYWLVSAAYLALALSAPAVLAGPPPSPGYVLASFLFWPVARPDGVAQPLYSLGWTLNLEILFYVLFAAALPLRRARALLAVAAVLLVLVGLGRFGPPQPFAAWGDPIVLEFAGGTALGWAWARGVTLAMGARLALAALGVGLLVALPADLPRLAAFGLPGLCLVAACGLARPVGRLAEGAGTRAAALAGDASYATYLLHPFVLRGLRIGLVRAGLADALGLGGFLLAGLAATLALSVAVHRRVERPLTAWLRRTLGG